MSIDLLQEISHKFHCEFCNYSTSKNYDYNKHLMTLKHKNNINNATFSINFHSNVASKIANYECSVCNYYTKNKSNYDKHLLTDKHNNKMNGEHKENKHICSICNKEYSKYNSLWKHKKYCVVDDTKREPTELQNTFTPKLFLELINTIIKNQEIIINKS